MQKYFIIFACSFAIGENFEFLNLIWKQLIYPIIMLQKSKAEAILWEISE